MYGETREPVSWDRFLAQVIRDFAQTHDMQLESYSGDWIFRLAKDGAHHFIFGLDLGLNNSASKLIARDKSATFEILYDAGVPAIPHHLFLRPLSLGSNPNGNWQSLQKLLTKYPQGLVCKPNIGSSGRTVIKVQNQAELEQAVQNIFTTERTLAVSPFVDMSAEYRVTVLNNTALHVYKKVKDADDLKFNLSSGAHAEEVTDEILKEKLFTLATDATRAIDITFANVDIAESNNGLQVLEINSGVMFEHYAKQGEKEAQTVTDIYTKALSTLFQ